jgi:hypothetical protein
VKLTYALTPFDPNACSPVSKAAGRAIRVRGTEGLSQGEGLRTSRRVGEVLHDAAEVVGTGRGDRTAPLRDFGTRHVVGVDGAPDSEPVKVSVAHVAKREAVEGLPNLARREPAHGDAARPLVGAPGVGALRVHTRELLDRLEWTGACGDRGQLRFADGVGPSRLASSRRGGDDRYGAEPSYGIRRWCLRLELLLRECGGGAGEHEKRNPQGDSDRTAHETHTFLLFERDEIGALTSGERGSAQSQQCDRTTWML